MGGIIGRFDGSDEVSPYLLVEKVIADNDIETPDITNGNHLMVGLLIGYAFKIENFTMRAAYAEGYVLG